MNLVNFEKIFKLAVHRRIWIFALLVPMAFFAGYFSNKPQSLPTHSKEPHLAVPVIPMPNAVDEAKIQRRSSNRAVKQRKVLRENRNISSTNKKFHAAQSVRQNDAVASPSDLVKE